jgi:hypothetical protein
MYPDRTCRASNNAVEQTPSAARPWQLAPMDPIVRTEPGRPAGRRCSPRALDYMVFGTAGNPCWAYACYGRKVEQAVALRKEGYRLMIVHDFRDALADLP